MKTLFGFKMESGVEKPAPNEGVPVMVNPPPTKVSKLPDFEYAPPPPPPPPQKVWKSYRASSCSEVTSFLNENGIDPKFMTSGANGQINIFFKA